MGGSGSGGYRPSTPSSPCAQLRFQAAINSPVAAVIGQLHVGAVLQVSQGGPQAVNLNYNGKAAGTLTGAKISQLINCMTTGFNYEATVITLNGGHCVVEVAIV